MPTDGDFSMDAMYRAVRDMAGDVVQSAPIVDAVAVVLWRESVHGREVFLARRAAKLSFLGGFWSFPGGRVDSRDGTDGGADIAAGVRELREELGVELPMDAAAYAHGGRWRTPTYAPIRFDALYLLHEYGGPEPDPTKSGGELDAGAWVTAARLRERWSSGEWLVPPPVMQVVSAMERSADESTWSAAIARDAAAADLEMRLWFPVAGIGLCPLRSPTLPPATHTNCYFVGTQEVVIVDPATCDVDERAALDRCIDELIGDGVVIREVLLSHHHRDHVAAARYLADSRSLVVAAHRKTADLLRGHLEVGRTIEDGERIALPGNPQRVLRAVWTPGHAPGHLCFFEESTGFLLAGDMVAGVGTILIEPSEGSMDEYLESLARLRTLPLRAILPAHGPTITEPMAKLEEYVAHRLWREQRVLDALRKSERATLEELVIAAYRDVPSSIHPLAARSMLAHLQRLAGQGRARQAGEHWVFVGSP